MANIYGDFVWWQGVVEDRIDPLMLGRCRVRILLYHTDNKDEIPTEELPWATIMQPTTSAGISGVGTTPTGPVEGTRVFGFFRDGEDAQMPVIMGTFGTRPEERCDPTKGFNDPFGQYPKDDYLPNSDRELEGTDEDFQPYSVKTPKDAEPDTNRLARGNLIVPVEDSSCLTDSTVPLSNGENSKSLQKKRATRQEAVPKALAGNLTSSIPDTNENFYSTNTGKTTDNLEYNLDEADVVTGFEITNGGSGYKSAPTVVIDNTGTSGSGASANAYITGDSVTSIIISEEGEGYSSAPTVTFVGGDGTGAAAIALVVATDITGISIDDGVDLTETTVDDPNYFWNEPHPRYGGVKKSKTVFESKYSSCYPHNHVRQSESGHVEEWDDTPGAERLHRYHKSGTFEEIQHDGTRVTKVVMDDYEIVAGEKNVLISKRADYTGGDLSITVEGNCRLLTMGSMVQEVRGNYHLNVLNDMRVKIGGNLIEEVMTARKTKIEQDDDLKVGKSKLINVGENFEIQVGGNMSIGANGDFMVEATNCGITAGSGTQIIGNVTCDIIGAKVGLSSAALTKIASDFAVTITCVEEAHHCTSYDLLAEAKWLSHAIGGFTLSAKVGGAITTGLGLAITSGMAILVTAKGLGGVKVTGIPITLN